MAGMIPVPARGSLSVASLSVGRAESVQRAPLPAMADQSSSGRPALLAPAPLKRTLKPRHECSPFDFPEAREREAHLNERQLQRSDLPVLLGSQLDAYGPRPVVDLYPVILDSERVMIDGGRERTVELGVGQPELPSETAGLLLALCRCAQFTHRSPSAARDRRPDGQGIAFLQAWQVARLSGGVDPVDQDQMR